MMNLQQALKRQNQQVTHLISTTEIPHSKIDILVLNSFNVETSGRNCGYSYTVCIETKEIMRDTANSEERQIYLSSSVDQP